jgi:signal transduction histidine kinase
MGILGMEERVKRLGGTLRVESQPGKGAAVTADLPIPAGGCA